MVGSGYCGLSAALTLTRAGVGVVVLERTGSGSAGQTARGQVQADHTEPLSPDGRRVLFGGRLHLRTVDERTAAQRLHRGMVRVWPELGACRLTHAWKGSLGFTFDRLPHMGVRDGMHSAMGCNGSGVAMAAHLGHQSALRILGRQNRPCPFEALALSHSRRVPRARLVPAAARPLVPLPRWAR